MPPAYGHGYCLRPRRQADRHRFHDDLAARPRRPSATRAPRRGCCARHWPTGTSTTTRAMTYARPSRWPA